MNPSVGPATASVVPAAASFVQVGATRDGLDPYLDCARRRGLPAVLVETPEYVSWRAALGRRPFDVEIGVAEPADAGQVSAALAARGVRPVLVLTGFERYVRSGFALAGAPFVPPDKLAQRAALSRAAPWIAQPGHVRFRPGPQFDDALAAMRFPQVVKPSDGGGGLGVLLARDAAERAAALDAVRATRNYDGGPFADLLVEEVITGTEYSIQGLVHGGAARVLTVCEKLTAHEPVPGTALTGFRELGHIGTHGAFAEPALAALAHDCVAAVGYRDGPFHVDVIGGEGRYAFVEMGFRLSGGGLVGLVAKVTGADWAELTFRTHLGDGPVRLPDPPDPPVVVGQATLADDGEIAAAEQLRHDAVAPARAAPGTRAVARTSVELHRAGRPPAGPPAGDGARLASDRARHVGVGRVVIRGDLPDVRSGLRRCVAGRL
ncbi:ATP-grasp domain-containing protein [Dactylosporangium sp. NPDC050688]|uniref:ATP-grasp domain-containing protein n=1 Tax=Dactylosporangium sp. NPDC050688 TaxID=3157217 RepID=UPI0033F7049C